MNKKTLMVVLSIVCVIVTVQAQTAKELPTVTLNVEDAVRYAFKNSRSLKSAAIDLEISKRNRDTVWGYLFPTVGINGAASRQNKVTDTMSGILSAINPLYKAPAITEPDHWAAAGGIQATLVLNGSLVNNIRAQYANYESGKITWEQTLKSTERDVRKMFFGILLLYESLNFQKTMLENARRRWIQAQTNFKNGLVPELTVLQSQVTYETRKPTIIELEQTIEQQLNMFGFLLGIPFGTKIVLSDSIAPYFIDVNAQKLFDTYGMNSFAIAGLKAGMHALNLQKTASQVQTFTPNISVSYAYSPALSPINKNWLDGNNWNDRGNFAVSLTWSISNMLPFSGNMVGISNMNNNLQKMAINLDSAVQNTEMQINLLVNKMKKSQISIEAQKLNVSLAQKAYDLTVQGFNAGTREQLEVRDAESVLSQSKFGVLQEEYNYIDALLDLEFLINAKLK